VEIFHNRLRVECLNQEDFLSVLKAQIVSEEWRLFYKRVHPHSKLGFQSPDQFAMNHPRPEPNIQGGSEMVTLSPFGCVC
jgi:transposase InsO family protein